MVLGKSDRYVQKNETISPPYTAHKNKFKDLNFRPRTIKILEENLSNRISDIAHSNILLEISPQARETKEKLNKRAYVKLKCFYTERKTSTK